MGTARVRGELLAAVMEEVRAEAGRQKMNPQRLADASGMSYSTVYKSLHDQRGVDLDELGRLCEALGVAPSTMVARAERLARDARDVMLLRKQPPRDRTAPTAD